VTFFRAFLQLESACFSWKTQISFLLVFFPFLLPLNLFYHLQQESQQEQFGMEVKYWLVQG